MNQSTFFSQTHDPKTLQKRKTLSAAFFKQKLIGMTEIIKKVTILKIRELQTKIAREGKIQVSLQEFTVDLYSSVIVSVCIGNQYADNLVDFELDDGKIQKVPIKVSMQRILEHSIIRGTLPLNVLFPSLTEYLIMPNDRRYGRNCDRLRDLFQVFINDRRGSKEQADENLLSILLDSELFNNNDELMKDEIFGFFFAGMKTLQASTTNLIYYLELNPEIKHKLLAEVSPVIAAASPDLIKNLDYDKIMEYEYLQKCFNETLRIEAPASSTLHQTVSQDIPVWNGQKHVTLKKETIMLFNINGIHRDPRQWPEPERFEPERFTPHHEKWSKAADGSPRNTFAFVPFFGGKRICLGKTFAEVTFRYTMPLIMYHIEFSFVDKEAQQKKGFYSAASMKEPCYLMNTMIRNKI